MRISDCVSLFIDTPTVSVLRLWKASNVRVKLYSRINGFDISDMKSPHGWHVGSMPFGITVVVTWETSAGLVLWTLTMLGLVHGTHCSQTSLSYCTALLHKFADTMVRNIT